MPRVKKTSEDVVEVKSGKFLFEYSTTMSILTMSPIYDFCNGQKWGNHRKRSQKFFLIFELIVYHRAVSLCT